MVFQIGALSTLLPILGMTFLAFIAYQQADQLPMLVLNSNVLSYLMVTAFPFLIIYILTLFLLPDREAELADSRIKFDQDYHYGPEVG